MLRLLVSFLDDLLCHWSPSFSVAYSLTASDGERRLERVPRSLAPGYNPVTLGCSPGLSFNWIRQIFKGKPIWKYSPPQTWEFLFQLFRGADGDEERGPEIRPGAPRKWIYETKNTASRNSVRALQVLLHTVHSGLRRRLHCKKVSDFPVPSRDFMLTKLSMAGNNLIIPGQWEFNSKRPMLFCYWLFKLEPYFSLCLSSLYAGDTGWLRIDGLGRVEPNKTTARKAGTSSHPEFPWNRAKQLSFYFSTRGLIQSPWLVGKSRFWHRVKVDSCIGLPMVNVLESTLEWT